MKNESNNQDQLYDPIEKLTSHDQGFFLSQSDPVFLKKMLWLEEYLNNRLDPSIINQNFNVMWTCYEFVADYGGKYPNMTVERLKTNMYVKNRYEGDFVLHAIYYVLLKLFDSFPFVERGTEFDQVLKLIETEFINHESYTEEKKEWKKLKNSMGHNKPTSSPQLKLSEKKGDKIGVIRVLNAFYQLHLVTDLNGDRLTKIAFMNAFGSVLGIDLSNYDTDLTQAQDATLEINIQVFEEMKEIAQKYHFAHNPDQNS